MPSLANTSPQCKSLAPARLFIESLQCEQPKKKGVFSGCKRQLTWLKDNRFCTQLLHRISVIVLFFSLSFILNGGGLHNVDNCFIRLPWSLSLPLPFIIISVLWIVISISLSPALTITLPMWWLMGSQWTWACGIRQGRRTTTGSDLCRTHRR